MLARISLASFEEQGASLLHSGVRAANELSQHVCRKCGLHDSDTLMLGVAYPPMLEGGNFTR